ncbi:MAG: 5-methylcytosine-specific restriction endonuclease system specificity protein McrC [bacterium]|nr:5-methylcytosine-specific restriction endonuclease system specificity protein McrC [bacterium]
MLTSCKKEKDIGYVGRIPVRNLWLLMLYSSNLFRQLKKTEKGDVEDNPDDIPDLVAEILTRQVEIRIKRNLSFGYQTRHSTLNKVRGRIDLLYTERHKLLDRGQVSCHFDELTVNTPRNCYVRSALDRISKIVTRKTLAHRCRSFAANLKQMGVIGESPCNFKIFNERFGRHDSSDRLMVTAAQLAFNLSLPTESAGEKYLSLPEREETWVRKLFEKGVAGFYDTVLSCKGWKVEAGKTIEWPVTKKSLGIDEILPSMRTDIILSNYNLKKQIIIDTKFNAVLTKGWYREETIRSGYLYQIYAYLRSHEDNEDPLAKNASGLLLHPSVDNMINESVIIQGHKIKFATVDLAADTETIRTQLLQVVE